MKTSSHKLSGYLDGAVRISVGAPRWIRRRLPAMLQLAPTRSMLSMPRQQYDGLMAAKLASLDPAETWRQAHRLVEPHEPILLCFEAPGVWCHRRMVAEWFEGAGFGRVRELGHEDGYMAYREMPNG